MFTYTLLRLSFFYYHGISITEMTKYIILLLFIGLAWGQSLYFTSNNGNYIEIKKFRKLQINDIGYRLIKTNYFEKQIIAVKKMFILESLELP